MQSWDAFWSLCPFPVVILFPGLKLRIPWLFLNLTYVHDAAFDTVWKSPFTGITRIPCFWDAAGCWKMTLIIQVSLTQAVFDANYGNLKRLRWLIFIKKNSCLSVCNMFDNKLRWAFLGDCSIFWFFPQKFWDFVISKNYHNPCKIEPQGSRRSALLIPL